MNGKWVVLLAVVSLVAAEELPANISGAPVFSGCNCRLEGTPNPVQVWVAVHNPSERTMRLSYEWFDSTIDDYRQDNSISCTANSNTVLAYAFDSCKLNLYTMMGGANGTLKTTFRITGNDGVDNYTKVLDVTINYHTSPYEINTLLRIQGVQSNFDKLQADMEKQCIGELCCGMLKTNEYLNLVASNLSKSNYSLRSCQFSSAWGYLSNAANSLLIANDSFMQFRSNCSYALLNISSTERSIKSVNALVQARKECGSDVSLSESLLRGANNSLQEASQSIMRDNYSFALSKLSDANNSIYSAMSSMGDCNKTREEEQKIIPPLEQNTTSSPSNQTSSGSSFMLMAGGVFVALILFVLAAIAVLSLTRPRGGRQALPSPPPVKSSQPPAPPAAPPAPEVNEDLEKEFNEWLDSHSQKK